MLRGVRFCSSLHLLSELAAREACAKDNQVYKVMIPDGKCLVNYAQGRAELLNSPDNTRG